MKKIIKLLSVFIIVFTVCACGSNESGKSKTIKVNDDMQISYKIDAPYYGNIKIGNSTFDMLSTKSMLKENGIEQAYSSVGGFKVKSTGDKFFYQTIKFDSSYEAELVVHNNVYEENGCINCDDYLSTSIELPKGITYNSTKEDVIKAYGEPTAKNSYDDNIYQWNDMANGEDFGGLSSEQLTYEYETEKAEMRLELWFTKSTGKLHKVEYNIEVKQ